MAYIYKKILEQRRSYSLALKEAPEPCGGGIYRVSATGVEILFLGMISRLPQLQQSPATRFLESSVRW